MKINNSIKIVLSISLISLITVIIIIASILNSDRSRQSDYPILPPIDAGVMMLKVYDIKTHVKYSDLIIEGTIIGEQEEVEETAPKDDVSRAIEDKIENAIGKPLVDQSAYNYKVKIKVDKIIKGNTNNSEIILNRSFLFIDSEPILKENDKMIFFLCNKDNKDNYIILHPQEGYLYISDDGRVYPAVMSDAFSRVSGMKEEEFCAIINEQSE